MGTIVYKFNSPLAEYARGYADEITHLLRLTQIDPGALYQEFLDCEDDAKRDFLRRKDLGPYQESVQDYILVLWHLTQLEHCNLNRETKGIVASLIHNLSACYDWGYKPHPREMAKELRQGSKSDFTQVMKSLIQHLLPTEPVAQNLALTLIQPKEFESCQAAVYKGAVPFRAVVEKCEDGRVLWIRAPNGKERPYRLRSLETLIGKVKKELDNPK